MLKCEMIRNENAGKQPIPFSLPNIGDEEVCAVEKVLYSDWLTMGQKTLEFESAIARYIGCDHAIAVSSCTAALHLSLLASEVAPSYKRINREMEVITSPFTFAATGNVIIHAGAKPVFVDIDRDTYNINPEKIYDAITKNTVAIIPVHYAGQPCDMRPIMELAEDHRLAVIEDAAHAIGAEYRGQKVGNLGNPTCFSFYATKNITTGEGGAITTNDSEFAEKVRKLRLHGISKDAWKRYGAGGSWKYDIEECGWKYNMTDINATIGLEQIRKLDKINDARIDIAAIYSTQLRGIEGVLTPEATGSHVFHLYPLLVPRESRDALITYLSEKGVGCSVHFIPLHLHSFYQRKYGFKQGDFPIAEWVYEREVSLPIYPRMTREDVVFVCDCIKGFMEMVLP